MTTLLSHEPDAIVYLGLLCLLALSVSALGFFRVVWFVSLGYAFSMVLLAIVTPILLRDGLDLLSGLHCALLLLYGLRLGVFLLRREQKASYQKLQKEKDEARGAQIRGGVKVLIWLSVALLYVLMFCPALYCLLARHADVSRSFLVSEAPGVAMMALGLGIESLADHQKSTYKARSPDRFCDIGLFRFARCPNYFGEIVFWVGQWVAGISAYTRPSFWVTSSLGLLGIVLVMLGSARRLELEQHERYGENPEYQSYIRAVPILFPFVPIYSLRNWKIYLG